MVTQASEVLVMSNTMLHAWIADFRHEDVRSPTASFSVHSRPRKAASRATLAQTVGNWSALCWSISPSSQTSPSHP